MRLARAIAVALVLATPAASAGAQSPPPRGVTIAAVAHQSRVRTALDDLMPPERTVPQVGLELGAPTFWTPLRVAARVLRATGGGDDLHSLDAGVLIGTRHVALEAAYAQRGSYSPTTGLAHGRVAEFARAGLRTGLDLGVTGFSMQLRANAYVPTWRAAVAEDDVEGWDAETGLTYVARALPVSATVGYRLERFRIFGVEQEVSALTFALGFTLIGR